MKDIIKRIACVLAGAGILIQSVIPVQGYTSTGALTIDSSIWYTMYNTKKLDLRNSNVNVTFSNEERESLKNQIQSEFYDDMKYDAQDVLQKTEELILKGTPLKLESGDYNPEWDSAWKEMYPETVLSLYTEHTQNAFSDSAFQKDGINDPIRLYARKVFMDIGTGKNALPEGTDPESVPDFIAYDDKRVPFIGNEAYPVGSVAWHKEYDAVLSGENPGPYLALMCSNYVEYRYHVRMNQIFRERIGDQLNVSFNFWLEEMTDQEKELYRVGSTNGLNIAAGKVNSNNNDGRALFSTVDFGGPNQATDEELSRWIRQLKNGEEQAMGYSSVLQLFNRLFWKDELSLTSAQNPFVHMMGYATHSQLNWPYASSTKAEEGNEWMSEPLSYYGNVLDGTSMIKHSEMIPMVGLMSYNTTGVNFYEPEFDETGRMISISKPLINPLASAQNLNMDSIVTREDFENQLVYYDKPMADYAKVFSISADDSKADIFRYKLTEEQNENGRLPSGDWIEYDSSTKILDFDRKQGQIHIFDDIEEADHYYQEASKTPILNAEHPDVSLLSTPDGEDPVHFLKAMHVNVSHEAEFRNAIRAPKFAVKYNYVSATENKELPQNVMSLLPQDDRLYDNQTEVNAIFPKETIVPAENGEWRFSGYNVPKQTIQNADAEFIGTWFFKANPVPEKLYRAHYIFESGTKGKVLPQSVEDLLPIDEATYQDGDVVVSKQPKNVKVQDESGIWRFEGYQSDSLRIDTQDVTFTGIWTFTSKDSDTGSPKEDPKTPKEDKQSTPTKKTKTSIQMSAAGAFMGISLSLMGLIWMTWRKKQK